MSDIDYELDDQLAVDTPERLKAIADPLRGLICDLVLQRSMSVTELADEVRRPRGTVAHHVQVLVDAGLVQVVRTRQVRAMTERFYGRTARTFLMSFDDGELPFIRDVQREYPFLPPTTTHTNREGFATLRHARISSDRFDEYVDRLNALSLEFSAEPRTVATDRGPVADYVIYVLAFPSSRVVRADEGADDEGADES